MSLTLLALCDTKHSTTLMLSILQILHSNCNVCCLSACQFQALKILPRDIIPDIISNCIKSIIFSHVMFNIYYRLGEQFPDLFNDLCLYSEVSSILSNYQFHLPARRFIQELFQHTSFEQVSNSTCALPVQGY